MPPDQGCYEERYRLTFPVAGGVALSFVALIPALFGHQPLPRGNKPARRCPVPGVAAGGRPPGQRLAAGPERLAALTAAVAPAN